MKEATFTDPKRRVGPPAASMLDLIVHVSDYLEVKKLKKKNCPLIPFSGDFSFFSVSQKYIFISYLH